MVNRLKVPAESVEHPEYSNMYPPEYWELVELTMAQVPDNAVKAYRDIVIGKGKGMPKLIKARHADMALRAGLMQHFGTDDPERRELLIRNQTVSWPEDLDDMLSRQAWYIGNGWPVIMIKSRSAGWPLRVVQFAAERIPMGHEIRLFEYDDESVWPVPTPTSWRTSGVQQGRPDQDQDQEEGHPEGD